MRKTPRTVAANASQSWPRKFLHHAVRLETSPSTPSRDVFDRSGEMLMIMIVMIVVFGCRQQERLTVAFQAWYSGFRPAENRAQKALFWPRTLHARFA